MSKGSYVLLGLLRMGQDSGIIKYLADAYDASEERGGVMMSSTTDLAESHVKYSTCARAYFLNCSDSETNDVVEKVQKKKVSKMEKQWSVSAVKNGTSHPFLGPTL